MEQSHSEETKKEISEALTGRTLRKNHRNRISRALAGRKLSEETRRRMSEAKKGMSLETRKRMSEAKKGKNHPLWGIRGEAHPKYGKKYKK